MHYHSKCFDAVNFILLKILSVKQQSERCFLFCSIFTRSYLNCLNVKYASLKLLGSRGRLLPSHVPQAEQQAGAALQVA